jgi:hypothetical protein
MIKLVGFNISGIPVETNHDLCNVERNRLLTGTSFGAQVAENGDSFLPFLYSFTLDSFNKIIFRIKYPSLPRETQSLLSCNLRNSTARGKVTLENPTAIFSTTKS